MLLQLVLNGTNIGIKMNDKEVEQVRKSLGTPVFPEFPEYIRKIRMNLIIVSIISLAVTIGSISIDPSSSFLGFKFNGLTTGLIHKILFVTNIYLLVHFIWGCADLFLEWCVRITGTRTSFITAGSFTNKHCDYPKDPRQSTLLNWWLSQQGRFEKEEKHIKTIVNNQEKLIAAINDLQQPNVAINLQQNVVNDVHKLKNEVVELKNSFEAVKNIIDGNPRVMASLKNFENIFHLLLRSQNLRWIVLELSMPTLISVYAMLLLWQKI